MPRPVDAAEAEEGKKGRRSSDSSSSSKRGVPAKLAAPEASDDGQAKLVEVQARKRPKVSGRFPASPCSRRSSLYAPPPPSSDLPEPARAKVQAAQGEARRPTEADTAGCLEFSTAAEECTICCEAVEAKSAVRLCCRHGWYCLACVERYVQTTLEAGSTEITCPQCRVPVAEADLRKLVDSSLVERLLVQSLEKAVCASADLKACPTPDCPMRVELVPGYVPKLSCPLCKKTSCLKCGVQPYHHRMSCEAYQARLRQREEAAGAATGRSGAKRKGSLQGLRRWMDSVGAKQCPTCSMVVTKQDLSRQGTQRAECHKMVCRSCSTKFCFKCLAVLTDTYTCGCSRDAHGFVDPHTGEYIPHFAGA